jgi:hypothetical protein
LSASRTGRLYPQECSWYSFSLGAESTPRAMVRSEGNMLLKNPVTPPGIDPGTVRLVAQRLNHHAVKYVLYFYISSFRSMCAVPNLAVFCSSLISCCIITFVNIIIIIIIIVSFMQGIHTRIPEKNHVLRGYTVASILSLLFMVPLSSFCVGPFVLLR